MNCRRFRDIGRADVVTILIVILAVLAIIFMWRRV